MKCYVINLTNSPGRLAHMRAALNGIGVAFERFEAINAIRSRQHPARLLIPPLRPRPWTDGELGCLMSHYDLWKRAAVSADPFTAIFEDDLHVDPRLAALINDPGAIPADADLIKLETVNVPVSLTRHEHPGPRGTSFAVLKTLHHGCGAYIVSRRAAAYLVRSINRFDLPADDVMFGFDNPLGRHLRRYQVLPALAVQDIILPPGERSPDLDSRLEAGRIAARDSTPESLLPAWQRTLPMRSLRWLVRIAGRGRRQWLDRELVVPFHAAGKSLAVHE